MTNSLKEHKIAIIGCGNMAKVHARLLMKHLSRSRLAVCDRDPIRLEDFSEQTQITNVYTDLTKLLEEFKPTIVHIVTPPSTHKFLAIECLKKGCHVFIEKPVAINTNEVDEIIQAAQQHQCLVCIDHMRSFDPLIFQAKSLMDSGSYGKITNIKVEYSYDYLKRIDTDAAARWIKTLPGGSFFDLMPHLLCILDDFLPNIKLEKSFPTINEDQLITDLHCLFSSSSGTGQLHLSLNILPLKNSVEFECTEGSILVDFRNFLIIKRKNLSLPNAVARIVQNLSVGFQYVGGSLVSIFNFLRGKLDPYAGLDYLIEHFLIETSQKGKSPMNLEKAKASLALTEKIFEHCLYREESNPVEERLPSADVLVTGGTGFIGRRLVNRLIKEGKRVRVFTHRFLHDDQLNNLYEGNVQVVRGNIYNQEDVNRACQDVQSVFHLAAAMKGDWNYHLDTTISGTRNILLAASQAKINHFIYASTLNVYDAKNYPKNGEVNENFPFEDHPQNRGAYSHAKLKAEKLVRQMMEEGGLNITIVRPGLVYGPGGPEIPGDVGRSLFKNMILVFGMGLRKIPFVYVDNVIDAFVGILNAGKVTYSKIYNIVDSDYTTQREFVQEYNKIAQKKLIPIYIPYWIFFSMFWSIEKILWLLFKKKVSLCYKLTCITSNPVHSTEKLREDIDWKQQIKFNDGLKLMMDSSGEV